MLNKKTGLIALLAGFAASEIMAGTITNYASGDVLVCFRKGAIDMVVDAGPISTFTGAAHNQVIPISQYTGTQLAAVGTNGVSWSAFTWLTNGNVLYMTRARASLNSQTTPWLDQTPTAQAGVGVRMGSIPSGALDQLTANVYPVSSSTAVVEDDDSANPPYSENYPDGTSYHVSLAGSYGSDFDGKFQGNPENTTPGNFITSGTPNRSDLYQMNPTLGFARATYLGYFEFQTDGSMVYVAYPTGVAAISSIGRSGNVTTLNYTTGTYGTYTLLETNNLAAPYSTWPAIQTLSTGDIATHIANDTTTDTNRFYIIVGQ